MEVSRENSNTNETKADQPTSQNTKPNPPKAVQDPNRHRDLRHIKIMTKDDNHLDYWKNQYNELERELKTANRQRDTEAKRGAILQEALEEIAGYDESYSTDPVTVAQETLQAIGAIACH